MQNQNKGEHSEFSKLRWLMTSLLITLVLQITLSAGQLIMLQSASFLGIQAQGVSWEMIRLYARTGTMEFLSLSMLVFCWLFPAVCLFRAGSLRKSNMIRFLSLLFPIAWIFESLACLIQYPALFEDYLGPRSLSILYKSSFLLNPDYLHTIACLLIALATIALLTTYKIHKIAATLSVAAAFGLITISSDPELSVFKNTDLNQQNDRPNLLILSVDSLRYDRTEKSLLTPHINKLKAHPQTLIFHDHHIGVPRTFPSWVELLQGKYAARTGIRHMFPPMALRRKPMPGLTRELLNAGYQTTAVSDFAGDIFPRFKAGFQTTDAPELSIPTLVRMGVDQAFPLFLPIILNWPGKLWFNDLLESPNFADAKSLKTKIISHLSQSKSAPFFLTGFFSTAHFPYAAPWPWNLKYTDRSYKGPYYFQKNPDLQSQSGAITPEDIRQIIGLYDGAVASTDQAIGDILDWLRAENIFDNTLIVITADHGEDLYDDGVIQGHGDHLKGNHVTRIPLMIKLPASSSIQGGAVNFTTRTIDIMPTLLSLLNQPYPEGDGVNLSPWLSQAEQKNAPVLSAYSETGLWFARGGSPYYQKERLEYPGISGLLSFDPGHTGDIIINPRYEDLVITAKHRSYIKGDYKLLYFPTHDGAKFKLYQRWDDPQNLNDIGGKSPGLLREMKQGFFKLVQEIEGKHQLIEDFLVES